MSSHKIFAFGCTSVNGRSPFGIELKEQLSFISPQIYPFIKNGINLNFLKCGFYHTVLISKENNIVWFGSMYDNTTEKIEEFNWKFDEIVDLRCGRDCSLFLTSTGGVGILGSNRFGTLAFEDDTPVPIINNNL